jgi:hypothetical protein
MQVTDVDAIYRKAFHHGAPLWRYLSATDPAALARGAAAFFVFGTAFLAAFLVVARVALPFELRPRAAGADFFFAERDDVLVFMARSL